MNSETVELLKLLNDNVFEENRKTFLKIDPRPMVKVRKLPKINRLGKNLVSPRRTIPHGEDYELMKETDPTDEANKSSSDDGNIFPEVKR